MLYTEIKRKIKDIKELTKLGLINPNWIRDLDVFEKYNFYLAEENTKQDSYKMAGDDFGISWQSVKLIVKKMLST